MPAARAATLGSGILPGVAGVYELPVEIRMVQEPGQLLGRDPQVGPDVAA